MGSVPAFAWAGCLASQPIGPGSIGLTASAGALLAKQQGLASRVAASFTDAYMGWPLGEAARAASRRNTAACWPTCTWWWWECMTRVRRGVVAKCP